MTQTYIGAPIRRGEDIRFLTGKATFIDDVKLPGMLYAAVLRSPHAHARIKSVDVSEALKLTGVVSVLTFADLPAGVKPIPLRMYQLDGLDRFLQYPLARGKVAYVGEPVALVAAVDRYVAEDGADAIAVEYEPLEVVPDVEAALRGRRHHPRGAGHQRGRRPPRQAGRRGGGVPRRRVHPQGGAAGAPPYRQPHGDTGAGGFV